MPDHLRRLIPRNAEDSSPVYTSSVVGCATAAVPIVARTHAVHITGLAAYHMN
ncbi:hypothetical protein PC116_g12962 [Phytophthora cactorum]|uniref:Uncharacterized protein n=1 Tax=Phytophthora cactorum TaxID=29920 RepID=A0A8T1KTU8_9STRA|nr:hypothetical protein PC114_g9102 [Phytophthora cactorum]KAG2929009.1 hypothetical protein PC117_g14140 [Phytophthora cactorum]KAG2991449.1 hypothetical protein PC120_g22700 [Phytophthora cactorum]KAG3156401.1 hypothetical protein C6341_g15077 [Phytophthora cactorum]KAG4239036.1 hypothetical protein PC116_g12962 [Phytophthora cactorum]